MSKKIILIANFKNTTHFSLTNELENYDHYFQKGSGNHYLKLIISPTPFIFNISTNTDRNNAQHFQI